MWKVTRKYKSAKIEYVGDSKTASIYLTENTDRTYKGEKLIKITLGFYPSEKRKQGEYK